jgi:hypothetical protein
LPVRLRWALSLTSFLTRSDFPLTQRVKAPASEVGVRVFFRRPERQTRAPEEDPNANLIRGA